MLLGPHNCGKIILRVTLSGEFSMTMLNSVWLREIQHSNDLAMALTYDSTGKSEILG